MTADSNFHRGPRTLCPALVLAMSVLAVSCGSTSVAVEEFESTSDIAEAPVAEDPDLETEPEPASSSPDTPDAEMMELPLDGETETLPDTEEELPEDPPAPIEEPSDLDEPPIDDAVVDAPEEIEEEPVPEPESERQPTSGNAELDLTLGLFGIEDPAAAAECIRAEVEADELDYDELVESDAIMVAVIRCERDAVRRSLETILFEDFSDDDGVSPDQIECVLDGLLDWTAALLLGDAEDILGQDDLPTDLAEQIETNCGLTGDELDALLNG